MDFMWLLRRYRNLESGRESTLYFEACEGSERLTLRRDFYCALPHGKWYIDPFCEVVTIPPSEVKRVTEITPREGTNLGHIIEAICQTLVELWEPGKAMVVLHSSGYDSRILSGCIRELQKECGDVLFLCNRWEGKSFLEIMWLQGWKKSHYAVYDEGPDDEHYRISLPFATHWHTVNAPFPIPGLFWQYLVDWAQGRGLLPKEKEQIVALNGQGVAAWFWLRYRNMDDWLHRYQDEQYYGATSIDAANGCHSLYPLVSIDVTEAVAGYAGKWKTTPQIRHRLAALMSPETVHIPNMHLTDHYAPIADSLRAECKEAFDSSWYGQTLGEEWVPPETADIDPRWGQYSLASLVEHLREAGTEVRWQD